MKHLLERKEWLRVNEAFFNQGSPYEKHKDTIMTIMDKLVKDYSYSPQLAAALAGNMFKESGFNPAIESPGGTYVGLIQWGGGRKAKLKAKPNWKTIDTQLKFIDDEFKGAYAKVKKAIEAAPTVEKAAEIVGRRYEVCADPTSEKRIKGAREIYDMYMPNLTAFIPPTLTDTDFIDQPPIEGQ
jgi:hypothetical protein